MASSALLSCSDLVNTPVKKATKFLVRILFIAVPVAPNEALEFSEKLFNWVQVWRIRRQINQLDSGFGTHLCNPFGVVE